jgi:uncharacterized repeat protein (TIGR01451 family)
MSYLSRLTVLGGVLAVGLAQADVITLATTAAAFGGNDTVIWSPQLGADGATIPNSFAATSTGGRAVGGTFSTTTGLVAKACNGCSWSPLTGDFSNNDFVIWSLDAGTNAGTGPVTLTFPNVSGAGAVVQADAPGQFTVKLELFNGATSLGFVTRTSDAAGDAIFIGALDVTVANANKAVFSLTASQNTGTSNFLGDFAMGPLSLATPTPDLSITKHHAGNFAQGQSGAVYTITVTNSGTAATSGITTVTDTLPAGLTFVSGTGGGFSCSAVLQAVTCTNTSAIPASANAAITLTVNVAPNAAATVTNSATVSNPNIANDADDTSSDPTTINAPDLSITKTHVGNFAQGEIGASYTITVSNTGTGATNGTTTVTDTLPAGLTFVSGSGGGFGCSAVAQVVTCTDAAAIPASANAVITLTVNIAPNAVASLTNSATVSNPYIPADGDDTALDPTTITAVPDGYLISYAANLSGGGSWVNLINAGTSGGDDATDSLCANVYVLAEDQQLIDCCTCPLTPNHISTLSVQKDLILNTLTPGVPIGVTIALVATTGATCDASSAASVSLAPGLRAWGTTVHAAGGGGFAVTETKFLPATLSPSELLKLTAYCGFIQADGSKFGLCNSCQPGASGATRVQ